MSARRRNAPQLFSRLVGLGIGALVLPSSASAQLDLLLRQLVQPPSYGTPAPYPAPYPLPQPGYRAPLYPPAYPVRPPYPPPGRPYVAAPSSVTAANPSFSCARAGTPAERAICASPELAALDRRLAETFMESQRTEPSEQAALVAGQNAWRRRRDGCGSDASCLRQTMERRIAELAAAKPGDQPQNLANATAPGGSAVSAGEDPLETLGRPPPGLRAWPLEGVAGHFVINDRLRGHSISRSEDFAQGERFFHLLALSALPDAVDPDREGAFLLSLLDDGARDSLFGRRGGGGTWGGGNEIQQAQTRRTFVRQYLPKLLAMAPQLPFRLHWQEIALLSPYDEGRRGFSIRPFGGSVGGGRDQLDLLSSIRSAGLLVAPGFISPTLFLPSDPADADSLLSRLPDRTVRLAADVEVGPLDASSKELTLQLHDLAVEDPKDERILQTFKVEGPVAATVSGTGAPIPPPTPETQRAVREWSLPVRAGLPWLDGSSDSAFALDSYGDFGSADGREPTPHEAWSRAVHALMLRTLPDSALDGKDLATMRLACIFLPRASQLELFGQSACGSMGGSLGAAFAIKDGAVAFRRDGLKQVQARTPRLPLRLLLVLPVSLQAFDLQRSGFPLGYTFSNSSEPISLFGSPLDVRLPGFWATTEAEGRRVVAQQSGIGGSRVFMAVVVTITEASSGAAPADPALLPGTSLHFHTDLVQLYLDAGLRRPLQDFTGSIVRVPQPTIDTAAEREPRPAGPLVLGEEAALLLLLAANPDLPSGVTVNWTEAANARFRFEQDTLRRRADWQQLDPWGTFFAVSPTQATVERYRAWTQRRAAALPAAAAWLRTLSPYPIENAELRRMLLLGDNTRTLLESRNFAAPGTEFGKQMEASGVGTGQLIRLSFAIAGTNPPVPVWIGVPQAVDRYTMGTDASVPPTGPNQQQPRLVVRGPVSEVSLLRVGGADGRAAMLIRWMPDHADVMRASENLLGAALIGPGWDAAQTAQLASANDAAAEQQAALRTRQDEEKPAAHAGEASVRAVLEGALSGAAYGPDIVGVRLGMRMADAERVIREQLLPSVVVEGSDDLHGLGPMRLFINRERGEQIGLLDRGTGHVLAIVRSVAVAEALTNEQLFASLQGKFGPPLSVDARATRWEWGKAAYPCVLRKGLLSSYKPIEGLTQERTPGISQLLVNSTVTLTPMWTSTNQPVPTWQALATCGPRLEVERTPTQLSQTVYDARVFGTQDVDRAEAAEKQAVVPKL